MFKRTFTKVVICIILIFTMIFPQNMVDKVVAQTLPGTIGSYEKQNAVVKTKNITGGAIETEGFGEDGASEGNNEAKEEHTDNSIGETVVSTVVTTAALRLAYSTDIHGQVNDYDYQHGKTVSRGLAKVSTLLQEAKEQVKGACLTFDIGDSIANYSTEYIHAANPDAIQPVYKAMEKIGYDAITLGNHEFDHGYEYLMQQLEGSKLKEKCVLSNVTSKVNGAYVLGRENQIIEKEVVDSNGNIQTIKVGIFGLTPPCMSSKTEGLRSVLVSEGMVAVAKRQAVALKEQGADVIVALAHTGFGAEHPQERASSTGYALCQIEEIDVVLGGHQHVYFPDQKNKEFYEYPGVDKETGLVNGTRFMILKDSGRAIGVVDLNFEIDATGKVVLKDSQYEIRKTSSDTENDMEISNHMSNWDKEIKEYGNQYIATVDGEKVWQNYTALLEDNEIIQVVHNAQMQYADSYVQNYAPEYKDLPILSMARYEKVGGEGAMDFSKVSGDILMRNLLDFSSYKSHVYIYKVSGKQLKEWMEWGASVYQTTYTSKKNTWDDMIIENFVETGIGDSLLQNDYIDSWTRFFVFNGVEYTIDPSVQPRYDINGKRINDTQRIVSLTYNGQPVESSQEFLLCTNQIITAWDTEATQGIKEQAIATSYDEMQEIICDYLKERAQLGTVDIYVDNNWDVEFPDGYPFVMKSASGSEQIVETKEWYQNCFSTLGDYRYYYCTYKKENKNDTAGPNVLVSSPVKEETNKPITMRVLANDKSGIKQILYARGILDKEDPRWQIPENEEKVEIGTGSAVVSTGGSIETGTGSEIVCTGGSIQVCTESAVTVTGSGVYIVSDANFIVTESGIYSVYVEDGAGNVTVQQVAVTNIYPEVLLKPEVASITNKTKYVKGTASPGTIVHVVIGQKEYQMKVHADGTFQVEIPIQKAGKKMKVYVSDYKGRKSSNVYLTVKRTGPNCPTATAKNNETKITGNCQDTMVKLYAVLNGMVYVSKSDGDGYYKTSKGYDSNLTIQQTDIKIGTNGNYTIAIPNKYAGTTIRVYAVDVAGRISAVRKIAVKKAAPDRPTPYTCTNMEEYVYGEIPNANVCKVVVKSPNGEKFYGKTDSNGQYCIKVGKLTYGQEFEVKAKGTTDEYSYPNSFVIQDANQLYKDYHNDTIKIYKVTDKDKELRGSCEIISGSISVYVNGKKYKALIEKNYKFSAQINKRQNIDTYFYAILRNKKGKLYGIARRKVVLGAPLEPKIQGKINTSTKKIVVYTKEQCNVYLKIRKKKYKTEDVKYNKNKKVYVYTYNVKKLKKKSKVVAYAKNAAGVTKSKEKKVIEKKAKEKKQ